MRYASSDAQRWVPEDADAGVVPGIGRREEFARDRARVLHSSALRRLAAKTQVVAPGSDDFVRNRLTHSLEVAQIGREFGAALGCDPDVVDTACLAHDLGHPPFGHNGETTLAELADGIGGFEGNAQSLRLLTRLEPKRCLPDGRSAGLNLTRASLDAATKYPWPRGGGPDPGSASKFGVYDEDRAVFDWFRDGAPPHARCLEAQVMDWSDDVAYSVHDVEDAIASRRLDPRALHHDLDRAAVLDVAALAYARDVPTDTLGEALDELLDSGLIPMDYDGTRPARAALKAMTSALVGRLLAEVERATRLAYGPGPLLRYGADLVIPQPTRARCAVLKAVAAHFVMHADEHLATAQRQRELLADLVRAYLARPERLDPDLHADWAGADSDAARLRVVLDQVASLSDARAVAEHHAWCGGGR